MRAIICCAVLSACLLVVWGSHARAADTVEFSREEGWIIAVDTTMGHGCFVVTHYDEGSTLRLGFDRRESAESDFYILFGNVKWQAIEYGKKYEIKIRFGKKTRWEGVATGFSFNAPADQTWLKMKISGEAGVKFVREYMSEQDVAFRYNGKEILRLGLKGSYRAGLQLIECQQTMIESGQDPFKDASSSGDDPFR